MGKLSLLSRCTLALAVLAPFTTPTASAQGGAAAYAIVDSTTGYPLDGVNAHKKLQVGSLTKVATAMVVLDWADATGQDLGQFATITQGAAALNTGAGVGFQTGDQCSLRDLLYAALLQSDNTAAQTLADHVGRSLPAPPDAKVGPGTTFVTHMNALARNKGMANTLFLNPHGLDHLEKKLPHSTAADMARLTSYAMANSAFRFYVSQKERKITFTTAAGEPSSYLLRNTNELLGVGAIDGVKTGQTRRAGPCLIISEAKAPESRQEGEKHIITPRRINVVVLGAPDRFPVARELMAKGWQLYDTWAAAGRPMNTERERGERRR